MSDKCPFQEIGKDAAGGSNTPTNLPQPANYFLTENIYYEGDDAEV